MDFFDKLLRVTMPFAIGGISGSVATLVIQPLDTLKVQVQIASQQLGKEKYRSLSLFRILMKIKQQKGLKVLYRGIDSAILRQIFYASTRLGAYDVLVREMESYKNGKATKLERAGISFVSGAFGALVGNPFDVALIRRQASIASGKATYSNNFDAFRKIVQMQGIRALWCGLNITIMRVACINLGQLAGRDIIAEILQPYHFKEQSNLVAVAASIVTAVISLPADNIKVKLQKQGKNEILYKGICDCFNKTLQREGIFRFWVGFPIYLARGAPHSFILIRTQMLLQEKWKNHLKQN